MSDIAEDTGLAESLVTLSHHILHLYADVGRAHGISQQQAEMICVVFVKGKIGMTELGKQLHLEKTNLSNLLERAEQRGLAIRSRDPDDRRIAWVCLTADGTRLANRIHAEIKSRLERLIDQLPVEDQQHVSGVVRRMLAAVNR
jgi:DNA-binding MarR family transcriptional regulator